MRWPTWHEWIEIAKYTKTLIFGKPLYRLATLLITLGVGLASGGTIGQVGFALFLGWVNQKLGTPIPNQAILDALSGATPVGVALILGGAALFIYAHSREEKQKKEAKPQFELAVQPKGDDNWMRGGEDKYNKNAKFTVTAAVDLVVGGDDLHLTDVEVDYYADGCCCLPVRKTYLIDGVSVGGELGSKKPSQN